MRPRFVAAAVVSLLLLATLPTVTAATAESPAAATPPAPESAVPTRGAAASEGAEAATAERPWWLTTSRDRNRNGIVDWLERQRGPTAVGLRYDHTLTETDLQALAELGIEPRVILPSIDGILIGTASPRLYPRLAALPGVVMIEPYGRVVFYGDVQTPAIKARNSSEYPVGAWDLGVTGKGVNIAVVDTGIDDEHPGLAGKFVAGFDAVCFDNVRCEVAAALNLGPRPDDGSFNPDDDNQHGTAVSGMATSTGANPSDPANEGRYMGAAPEARLVDVRIGTALGAGPFENYFLNQSYYESAIDGLEWVIEHKDDQWPNVPEENWGIDIISLSWGIISHENGGSDGTDPYSFLLDQATRAGIVVSVAAGNDGPNNDGFNAMGASSLSVTVGALDDRNTIDRGDDTIAGYSSRGPRRDNGDGYPYDELKPDVSAPGSNIVQAEGCYTSGSCNNNVPGQDASDNGYSNRGSGTSYATPAVAGVMALLLDANGNLTPAIVKEILRLTAERRGPATFPDLDPFWNKDYGWGMVDALAAVEAALLLADPENVDVELQAHFTAVETNATVSVTGLAWARWELVGRVEYRLDEQPWREVTYDSELPDTTGEYLNWSLALGETELLYTGNHSLSVRAVGADGRHSLAPHIQFYAAGTPPEEEEGVALVVLLLGAAVTAAVLVAAVAVWNNFGRRP